MSKFNKTVRSKYYWIAKGQGKIHQMLNENVNERGDAAKLAKKIGATPGYVSQILSGESEINPTWKKIVKFCLALGKVPVLELKDQNEYLQEQSLKASYRNSNAWCHSTCSNSNPISDSEVYDHNSLAYLWDIKKDMDYNSYDQVKNVQQFDECELI